MGRVMLMLGQVVDPAGLTATSKIVEAVRSVRVDT
jgi:hypothetical protein